MRSPPLIVWRTCHQTETHSARRSLHKYWRTQKKRESRLFLGWLIPAGRRKINSNFERMLPTPRETDAFLPVTQKAISSRTVLRYSPFFFFTPSKQRGGACRPREKQKKQDSRRILRPW